MNNQIKVPVKFIQDICGNIYNLDYVTGFEHEYNEDHDLFDFILAMGTQRYILISEAELYGASAEKTACLLVGAILDKEDCIVSNKELFSILKEYVGRLKRKS